MHVLLVAWGFPPSRASGVHRAVAIARWLVTAGHQVSVLTADEQHFRLHTGVDTDLLARLPGQIRIVRVPYPPPRNPIINQWPARRTQKPQSWSRRQREELEALFPEPFYGGWRDRLLGTALRLHAADPVDLCIATGNPYVSYVVPDALQTYAGVPMLLDDRDTFVFNVYTGQPRAEASRSRAWLRSLGPRALELWYVNPPIAQLYRHEFPEFAERIHVVENGWDPWSFHPEEAVHALNTPVVFGYVGVINAGFPLGDLMAGWRRIRGRQIPADAQLRLVGALGYQGSTPEQRTLLAEGAALGVSAVGPVPKHAVTDAYRGIDVLVFAREGGALVTSSKIYEYTATGLPIAVVAPVDHDSRRVLAGYPRAHIAADTDPGGWESALVSGYRDAVAGDAARQRAAQETAVAFRRDHILAGPLQRVCDAAAETVRRSAAGTR